MHRSQSKVLLVAAAVLAIIVAIGVGELASHMRLRYTEALVAAKPIAANTQFTTANVAAVRMPAADLPARYVPATRYIVGRFAAFALPAGSPILNADIARGPYASLPASERVVALPVPPDHTVMGISTGQRVDVWAAPSNQSQGAAAPPVEVLQRVPVEAVVNSSSNGQGITYDLDLSPPQVAALVGALAASDQIFIEAVPPKALAMAPATPVLSGLGG